MASFYIAAMTAFLKMHGLGNDFVVFDARKQTLTLTAALARILADRRHGIGCDQIIVIGEGPRGADAFMRILNADGSEVEMCGNAARCVASLLLAESGKDTIKLATPSGVLACARADDAMIRVDMGAPQLNWNEIPLAEPCDTDRIAFSAGGRAYEAAAVSMGNPHCVLFFDTLETVDVARTGPAIETHSLFPNRTNVEFVSQTGPDSLRMRVWERGVGITQACGSGASAAFVAARRRGMIGDHAVIQLDGGTLHFAMDASGHVLMTGPVTLVFTGDIDLGELLP